MDRPSSRAIADGVPDLVAHAVVDLINAVSFSPVTLDLRHELILGASHRFPPAVRIADVGATERFRIAAALRARARPGRVHALRAAWIGVVGDGTRAR